MDNLTHTLIGATLANAGLKQRLGRGTTLALIIASNITDIDILGGFFQEGPSFMYRRMWTHSILGMPVLSLVFGFLFGRLYPNLGFKKAFGLFILGTALHVLYDLMNSYGVVLLHPFSLQRWELAWVFIIDLAIWAILLIPLVLAMIPAFRPRLLRCSQIGLILLTVYTSICGAMRWRANSLLEDMAATRTGDVVFTYVFPEALGPHRFRGAIRIGDRYSLFLIHPLLGRMDSLPQVATEEAAPEVQLIKQTKKAQDLLWFAKAPVWKRVGESDIWEVYDLRFGSAVLNRGNFFAYRFRVNNAEVEFLGR